MAKILTRRKQAWVDRRQPDMIQGDPITPPSIVASRYYYSLTPLILQMTEECEKQVKALFSEEPAQEYFATDASVSSQARIITNYLLRKFNSKFAKQAKPIADRFTTQADKASSAQVHSSIQKLSGGLSLPTSAMTPDMREVYAATATENIALIKSISQKYLTEMQQAVMRSITSGNGLPDLMPYLQKQKKVTLRRAHLISLDQTRKTVNNFSKDRMQKLGVEEYKWLHTAGSDEPRVSHERMSGNIYRFDDPPVIDERTGERGIPGQAINCRCRMVPVIKFS